MASLFTEWFVQLINSRTGKPIDDDSGVYNVLTANDPAELTIYSDEYGTSGSNPGTITNGIVRFFTASSVTSVDLSVLTATGHACFVESLTPSQHRILIDPEKVSQQLIVPYLRLGASDNTIIDTGFTLSANMVVKDVWVHVVTATTIGILDIGTSTDTDGFFDAVSCANTGFHFPDETDASAHILGVLLASLTSGGERFLYRRANATSGASLIYTADSATGGVGAGYIYYIFDRLPTG